MPPGKGDDTREAAGGGGGTKAATNKWLSSGTLAAVSDSNSGGGQFGRLKKSYATMRKSFRLQPLLPTSENRTGSLAGNRESQDELNKNNTQTQHIGRKLLGSGAAKLFRGFLNAHGHALSGSSGTGHAHEMQSTSGSFKPLVMGHYGSSTSVMGQSMAGPKGGEPEDRQTQNGQTRKRSEAELEIEQRLRRSKRRVLPSASYRAPERDLRACEALDMDELEEIKCDNLRLTLRSQVSSPPFTFTEAKRAASLAELNLNEPGVPGDCCSCTRLDGMEEPEEGEESARARVERQVAQRYCSCVSLSSSSCDTDRRPEPLAQHGHQVAPATDSGPGVISGQVSESGEEVRAGRSKKESRASSGFAGASCDINFNPSERLPVGGGNNLVLENICGERTLASSVGLVNDIEGNTRGEWREQELAQRRHKSNNHKSNNNNRHQVASNEFQANEMKAQQEEPRAERADCSAHLGGASSGGQQASSRLDEQQAKPLEAQVGGLNEMQTKRRQQQQQQERNFVCEGKAEPPVEQAASGLGASVEAAAGERQRFACCSPTNTCSAALLLRPRNSKRSEESEQELAVGENSSNNEHDTEYARETPTPSDQSIIQIARLTLRDRNDAESSDEDESDDDQTYDHHDGLREKSRFNSSVRGRTSRRASRAAAARTKSMMLTHENFQGYGSGIPVQSTRARSHTNGAHMNEDSCESEHLYASICGPGTIGGCGGSGEANLTRTPSPTGVKQGWRQKLAKCEDYYYYHHHHHQPQRRRPTSCRQRVNSEHWHHQQQVNQHHQCQCDEIESRLFDKQLNTYLGEPLDCSDYRAAACRQFADQVSSGTRATRAPKRSLFGRLKRLLAPNSSAWRQTNSNGREIFLDQSDADCDRLSSSRDRKLSWHQKSATLTSKSTQNLFGTSLRYLSASRKSINLAGLEAKEEHEAERQQRTKVSLMNGFLTLGRTSGRPTKGSNKLHELAASQIFVAPSNNNSPRQDADSVAGTRRQTLGRLYGSADSLPSADSGLSCGHLPNCCSSSDDNYGPCLGTWQASPSRNGGNLYSRGPGLAEQQQQSSDHQVTVSGSSYTRGGEVKRVGRARALVDCNPCAYDREALVFKRGDLIDILERHPSGTWVGRCPTSGQVGHFKFINVAELEVDEEQESPGVNNCNNKDHLDANGQEEGNEKSEITPPSGSGDDNSIRGQDKETNEPTRKLNGTEKTNNEARTTGVRRQVYVTKLEIKGNNELVPPPPPVATSRRPLERGAAANPAAADSNRRSLSMTAIVGRQSVRPANNTCSGGGGGNNAQQQQQTVEQSSNGKGLDDRLSNSNETIRSSLEQLLFAIGLAGEQVNNNNNNKKSNECDANNEHDNVPPKNLCNLTGNLEQQHESEAYSYLDVLNRGGIKSLDSFSAIQDWHELEQIGIIDDEHQRRLLMAARIIRQASQAARLDFVENHHHIPKSMAVIDNVAPPPPPPSPPAGSISSSVTQRSLSIRQQPGTGTGGEANASNNNSVCFAAGEAASSEPLSATTRVAKARTVATARNQIIATTETSCRPEEKQVNEPIYVNLLDVATAKQTSGREAIGSGSETIVGGATAASCRQEQQQRHARAHDLDLIDHDVQPSSTKSRAQQPTATAKGRVKPVASGGQEKQPPLGRHFNGYQTEVAADNGQAATSNENRQPKVALAIVGSKLNSINQRPDHYHFRCLSTQNSNKQEQRRDTSTPQPCTSGSSNNNDNKTDDDHDDCYDDDHDDYVDDDHQSAARLNFEPPASQLTRGYSVRVIHRPGNNKSAANGYNGSNNSSNIPYSFQRPNQSNDLTTRRSQSRHHTSTSRASSGGQITAASGRQSGEQNVNIAAGSFVISNNSTASNLTTTRLSEEKPQYYHHHARQIAHCTNTKVDHHYHNHHHENNLRTEPTSPISASSSSSSQMYEPIGWQKSSPMFANKNHARTIPNLRSQINSAKSAYDLRLDLSHFFS